MLTKIFIAVVTLAVVGAIVYLNNKYSSLSASLDATNTNIRTLSAVEPSQLDQLRGLISSVGAQTQTLAANLPDGVEVGSVHAYVGTTEPTDYAFCDGRQMSISTYSKLFTVIGTSFTTDPTIDASLYFQLPDLRGQFVRGFDPTNVSRALGSVQQDATALPKSSQFKTDTQGAHTHTTDTQGAHTHGYYRSFTGYSSNLYHPDVSNCVATGLDNRTLTVDGSNTIVSAGAHSHTTNTQGAHVHSVVSGGDSETRPRNIALNYIIKIK